jgi:hypothetical protein
MDKWEAILFLTLIGCVTFIITVAVITDAYEKTAMGKMGYVECLDNNKTLWKKECNEITQ